ncbi:MAG: DUF481 domain-containing protein [Candidatus Aminicenantes bacterium]|nr:DUF481 domain-containing protein [Candidatus Aminicenantes bacterium]
MNAKKTILAAVLTVSLGAFLAGPLFAQAPPPPPAGGGRPEDVPRVFLEAPGFDLARLQKDIGFVTFVTSLEESQVQVTVALRQAEGGEQYVLTFTGRDGFKDDNNILFYKPEPGATQDQVLDALARTLRMGLVRYAAKTSVSKQISVDFEQKVKPTSVVDPWDFWVFSLSGNGFLNGQQSMTMGSYNGSFSASRVTPEFKFRASGSANYGKDVFKYEGEEIASTSESYYGNALGVKSLGEHWSAGGYVSGQSSTYMNIARQLTLAPAIEYDIFPYSESTKRQLRILYKLGITLVKYREETIYNKTSETLWSESLTATLELVRPWGTASASLEGSHYFHNIKFYRLELNGEISFRLWKGLSFNIDGGGSRIHDQLGLPLAGASLEEVLLRRKQLETSFDYYFSVGLSLTFGSIQSKVVNPRFGAGEGGVSISISY